MQQRQLRLGDILDDYCPRERRLANHTIVAMVGNDVRLTRCTTCDTEHPYKGGKAPRLRKKKTSVEAAYDEVLESVKQEQPQAVLVSHPESEEPEPTLSPLNGDEPQDAQDVPEHNDNGNSPAKTAPEEVRLHRPLIRAQLPRIEREPAATPCARVHDQAGEQAAGAIPEQQFTVRTVRQEAAAKGATRAGRRGAMAGVTAEAGPKATADRRAPAVDVLRATAGRGSARAKQLSAVSFQISDFS